MDFLRMLAQLRCPALDFLFSAITHLGEETVLILAGLVLYWCVSKREAYHLLFVGLFGSVTNQFLKIVFRVPRPWVRDPSFEIVESAREAATGYSFPSGHTQASVGTFGSLARLRRERWIRLPAVVLCVLVPFSRLYLGVHTPADVAVGALVSLLLIFGFSALLSRTLDNPRRMHALFALVTGLTAAYLLFVSFHGFPADIDAASYAGAVKNGYKMLGCFAGFWLSYGLDRSCIHFETRAPLPGQVLKLVLGLVPVLIIKSLLKAPLAAILGGHPAADGLRYFLIALFAGAVWPLTFRFFAKIGRKK
ncbi:MAG: phosphatase PAP2 family protein [Clostridia bacterium]|nr:phosphatase PAP2 family protein [Clostridia bacterium]